MARGVTDDINYKNIADAIREKTGVEDAYTPSEMPDGIDEVYDKGRTVEWSEFWDSLQENGNRTTYEEYIFYKWTDVMFKPKYDFRPGQANRMFENTNITNLAGKLEQQGVELDFSKLWKVLYRTFAGSQITHIPDILPPDKYCSYSETFRSATKLITIDSLKSTESTIFTAPFYGCTSLKNIAFVGVIANNLDMQYSPLSKESIINIINTLSETASGMTLTLKKSAVNEAFLIDVDDATTYPLGSEYYTLRHSKDNWTISYV